MSDLTAGGAGASVSGVPAVREALNAQPTRYVVATAGLSCGLALTVLTTPLTGSAEAISGLLLQLSFLVCGVAAWNVRPHDRTGPLMVVCGLGLLFWMAAVYRPAPTLAAVSWMLHNLWQAVLIQLIVAFPGGRLKTREERWFVGLAYGFAALWTPLLAVGGFNDFRDCDRCAGMDNPLHVDLGQWLVTVREPATVASLAVLGLWLAAILVRRWSQASAPARRVLAPVFGVVLAGIVVEVGWNVAFALGGSTPGEDLGASSALSDVATLVYSGVLAMVPLGLIAGLLRTNVTRSRMGQLVTALARGADPDATQGHMAAALGDPSLRVAYRVGDTDDYVDAAGAPLELPAAGDAVRVVRGADGRPLAALIHDPALLDDEGLVDAVAAAGQLALENARLHAEVRAQLLAVRESRRRIVEEGDLARRRIERDLHDGAQQHLVALSLSLTLAHERAAAAGDEAELALLARAAKQAESALEELRELARGVHPQALSIDGLRVALPMLARRSPLPVRVDCGVGRIDDAAEATAYFVASEALANAAKHAGASGARIEVVAEADQIVLTVADDGRGGADPAGHGLRGLADRVEAVGGSLEIESPPGGGTRIVARIPAAKPKAGGPHSTDPAELARK